MPFAIFLASRKRNAKCHDIKRKTKRKTEKGEKEEKIMASTGYKLFRTLRNKPGKLFPLYVYADKEVPIGEWVDAECGIITKNGNVKSLLGPLAYRPGWHINDGCPYVTHIYSIHGGKKYQKDNTVWCEVEYSDDIDYQEEANLAGTNKKGKIIPRKAYLKKIPENGCYHYKTSPSMYGEWIIAGCMKIVRVLSFEEVKELCAKHGLTPLEPYKKEKKK